MTDLDDLRIQSRAYPSISLACWYVVHTKPRQEQLALEQLQRQQFEAYLPMYKVLLKPHQLRRRQKAFEAASANGGRPVVPQGKELMMHEPMFPRYLFLRPTRKTQSLAVVRSTLGVSRLVLFGQQPATLADGAVQTIRQAESLRESATVQEVSPYEPGMPVRLLDPALAGLQALVQSVSKDRVTLLLEILGRPQSVQVEFGRIAPL